MTHPLVSAFHNCHLAYCRVSEPSTLGDELDARLGLLETTKWIDEVMASTPQISCYVGFLMGYNCQTYTILLWPLTGVEYYYTYWVEDEVYYRLTPCAPGKYQSVYTERVALPHFLRS